MGKESISTEIFECKFENFLEKFQTLMGFQPKREKFDAMFLNLF